MIGGSGERQTLRIVAKYGDACNLPSFGSVETVKRKSHYGATIFPNVELIVFKSLSAVVRYNVKP